LAFGHQLLGGVITPGDYDQFALFIERLTESFEGSCATG